MAPYPEGYAGSHTTPHARRELLDRASPRDGFDEQAALALPERVDTLTPRLGRGIERSGSAGRARQAELGPDVDLVALEDRSPTRDAHHVDPHTARQAMALRAGFDRVRVHDERPAIAVKFPGVAENAPIDAGAADKLTRK